MDENHERPDDQRVSRILDELEEARWTYLGDVRHLVDPDDSELLEKLADACDRRLESALTAERRERLGRIRKRLRTAAALNEYLPIVPIEELLPRLGGEAGAAAGPGPKKRTKRGHTAAPVPGFEAYHARVTRWIDEKGLNQSTLAQHLEVDPSYLSRAIRGERKNRGLFLKIEELTGIAVPFVAEDDEDPNPDADLQAGSGADEGGNSDPDQVN